MITKLLHFVVPEHPTPSQLDCIARATDTHPSWQIKVWQDNVSPGERLSHYLPKCNSGAQRADLVRLAALIEMGGIYLDTDFVLHRPLDPLAEHYEFFICAEDGYHVTNAALGAAPGHPALLAIANELQENEPDWSRPPNETTGPFLYSTVLKWRNDIAILPRETFYPYSYGERPSTPRPLTVAEHLWKKSWKSSSPRTQSLSSRFATRSKALARQTIQATYRWLSKAHRIGVEALAQPRPYVSTAKALWYSASREIVLQTPYGHVLVLSGHDLSITPHILFNGIYEEAEENFVANILKGGDWFIDVGANIGSFSMLGGSKVGPFGRVLSFEPNPMVAGLLRKAAVTNWMHDRIVVHQCALGDAAGHVNLTFSEARLGDGRVQYSDDGSSAFNRTLANVERIHSVVVEQKTLDEVIPVDLPVKLLKIDAEGQEGAILRGARRLLAALAFEFIIVEAVAEVEPSRWQKCLAEFDWLVGLGYGCGTLSGAGKLEPARSLQSALNRERSRSLVFFSGREP